MMAGELNWLSAAKLIRGYRKKKFSPLEVAEACLAQIERHDKAINAMCLVDEKQALKPAKESEERSLPDMRRWRLAPTAADRSGSLRASLGFSGISRPSAGFRPGRCRRSARLRMWGR